MFTKTGILERFQLKTLPVLQVPNINLNTLQKHFPAIFTKHELIEGGFCKKYFDLVFTLVSGKI